MRVDPAGGAPRLVVDGQPVPARMFWGAPGAAPIGVTPEGKAVAFEFVAKSGAANGTMHFRFGQQPGDVGLEQRLAGGVVRHDEAADGELLADDEEQVVDRLDDAVVGRDLPALDEARERVGQRPAAGEEERVGAVEARRRQLLKRRVADDGAVSDAEAGAQDRLAVAEEPAPEAALFAARRPILRPAPWALEPKVSLMAPSVPAKTYE